MTKSSDWQEVLREFEALFGPHRADFGRLFEEASAYFAEAMRGKVYARRPNVSLRLPALGEPAARLIVYPCGLVTGKGGGGKEWTPCLGAARAEFLVCRRDKPKSEVGLVWSLGVVKLGGYYPRYGPENIGRMAQVCRDFLTAPAVVFARSATACCVCGKTLTDGVSRARGIGPECLGRCSWLRPRVERTDAQLTFA
jgi:hypothetical protein